MISRTNHKKNAARTVPKTSRYLWGFLLLFWMGVAGCTVPATIVPSPPPPPSPGSDKPVLVFVHGFQGFSFANAQECKSQAARYPSPNYPMGALPGWFANNGYEVWLASYKTGPTMTPSLESNAACLQQQLRAISNVGAGTPLVIVAHSMGGLVSRAALSNAGNAYQVDKLITLGSPHGGLPLDLLAKLNLVCQVQQGLCELATNVISDFNSKYPNRPETDYWFLGGQQNPAILDNIIHPLVGNNDGLVGAYSSVGLTFPDAQQNPPGWQGAGTNWLWTDETHGNTFLNGFAYYSPREGAPSYAFSCITAILNPALVLPGVCEEAQPVPNVAANPTPLQFTAVQEVRTGTSGPAGTAQLQTDSESVEVGTIFVFWEGAEPDLQLTAPGEALLEAGESDFATMEGGEGFPPFAMYDFRGAAPGNWALNAQRQEAGTLHFFALVESNRVLSIETDKDVYALSDGFIQVSASLTAAGVPLGKGQVRAYLEQQESAAVELVFEEGVFKGTLPVPTGPGPYLLTVIAEAQDGEISLSRQADLVILVGEGP